MAAADFFLPEIGGGDPVFRGPRRDGIRVDVLVDGHDTFAAMELSAARATTSVFLTTWMFGSDRSPGVALSSPSAVRKALSARGIAARPQTWVALLETLAAHGVDVRIILTDFDAVMAPGNHLATWRAHDLLLAAAIRAERAAGARTLHVLASLHPATNKTVPGKGIDAVMRPRLTKIVSRIAGLDRAGRLAELRRRPGIWPFIDVSAALVPSIKAAPEWRLSPVTHHQKLLIVDARIAYCGGLDLAVPRADTQRHESTRRRWHDVHCLVDGAAAFDLARGFVGRWTPERAQFDARVAALAATQPRLTLATQAPTAVLHTPSAPPPGAGAASAQALRTTSTESLIDPVPTTVRDDIALAYQNAIERARRFVYIENQYVRDERLVGWIATARAASPELEVIVAVPVAPEEANTPPIDEITEDGMAMQARILADLTAALTTRFGAFSMVAKARRSGKERTTDAPVPNPPVPNPPGFPSRQIYLHSKVLIVDDEYAIVGSANANPRSFQIDTEACVGFHHPATVTAMRLNLWRELLGAPAGIETWPAGTLAARWQTIADANVAAATPNARRGFVIPHDSSRFPGKNHPLIPDAFAGLVEEDADFDAAIA